jgi:hypothetical protein
MAEQETITRPVDRSGAAFGSDDRSLGDLIRDLADKSGRLVSEEVALAKAEMREKADQFTQSAKQMVIGGAMLMAAMLVLLVAINRILTTMLVQFMAVDMALWVSPLILAVVLGLIGMSMFKNASSTIKKKGMTPTKSIESLREEKDWIKHTVKEARNG